MWLGDRAAMVAASEGSGITHLFGLAELFHGQQASRPLTYQDGTSGTAVYEPEWLIYSLRLGSRKDSSNMHTSERPRTLHHPAANRLPHRATRAPPATAELVSGWSAGRYMS